MLTMTIPNTQGKRSSPSGGRIRSSCGYHHQRHQACHDTCEGRKTHPPKDHPPVRDKFAVGCVACQAYFSEQHQEILSPVSKRLTAQAHTHTNIHTPPNTPHTPEQQLTTHHSFNSKFEEFTSIAVCTTPNRSPNRSPISSPPHTPKMLASLTHEVEYELLQQHHIEISQKHRLYEQEEQLLLQYRQQLDKMRHQQETERLRIQQQQQVLDYQKQQQELELRRIHQYQLELDDVRREQELQRLSIKQQQVEIVQARIELEQEERLLHHHKKHDSHILSSSAPPIISSSPSSLSMFLPLIEKSHSPNPTTRASHSMEEENAARDLLHVHATSHKRPLSDILGSESEEASHKSNSRRSG